MMSRGQRITLSGAAVAGVAVAVTPGIWDSITKEERDAVELILEYQSLSNSSDTELSSVSSIGGRRREAIPQCEDLAHEVRTPLTISVEELDRYFGETNESDTPSPLAGTKSAIGTIEFAVSYEGLSSEALIELKSRIPFDITDEALLHALGVMEHITEGFVEDLGLSLSPDDKLNLDFNSLVAYKATEGYLEASDLYGISTMEEYFNLSPSQRAEVGWAVQGRTAADKAQLGSSFGQEFLVHMQNQIFNGGASELPWFFNF